MDAEPRADPWENHELFQQFMTDEPTQSVVFFHDFWSFNQQMSEQMRYLAKMLDEANEDYEFFTDKIKNWVIGQLEKDSFEESGHMLILSQRYE